MMESKPNAVVDKLKGMTDEEKQLRILTDKALVLEVTFVYKDPNPLRAELLHRLGERERLREALKEVFGKLGMASNSEIYMIVLAALEGSNL